MMCNLTLFHLGIMSEAFRIRAKDTDGLEFEFLFTREEFDFVRRLSQMQAPLIEIQEHHSYAFTANGRTALCLRPPASPGWHFFEYEQFIQGASAVT